MTNPHQFKVGSIPVGTGHPMVLVAGPCVIESEDHVLFMADSIQKICDELSVPLIFKASFDKANRSAGDSFRGPGVEEGVRIFQKIKDKTGLPLLTDVHEKDQVEPLAEVCDILQIPAFLSRQTDFVQCVGKSGKPVNVKKAQFMAPEDIVNVVSKLNEVNCKDILLTERGVSFGYRNLVSDFRSLPTMRDLTGLPICYDATHSVQQPGGLGNATGGKREFVPVLARAACAVGIDVLFMEVHDNPDEAKSDGPNMLRLADLKKVLQKCRDISQLAHD